MCPPCGEPHEVRQRGVVDATPATSLTCECWKVTSWRVAPKWVRINTVPTYLETSSNSSFSLSLFSLFLINLSLPILSSCVIDPPPITGISDPAVVLLRPSCTSALHCNGLNRYFLPDAAAKVKKPAPRTKFSETIVGALKSKKGVFASAMENDTSATAR